MKRILQKGDSCLNCGKELHDENFCPDCGQLNDMSKPTFGQLVMDALANLFAFDSKFYLSLWPLLRRPGKLSLEVVNGRKNTFLPPIRLFVLVTIIMLATNSLLNRCERGWNDNSHLRPANETPLVVDANDTLQTDTTKSSSNSLINRDIDASFSFSDNSAGKTLDRMHLYAKKHPEFSTAQALKELNLPSNFWYQFWYSNMYKLATMDANQFKNYIQSNLLLILLLFIPVLALLLKVLYVYKGIYYVDHFVFALHTQTAFFVFIIGTLVLSMAIGNTSLNLIFLGFPIYLLFALKNFYQQRWAYTVLNFIVINISFFVVSLIFIFLVAVVSFLLI